MRSLVMSHDARPIVIALTHWLALDTRALRRGAFVVVVGPDGVGKTTTARAIIANHDGPTGYFHFLPPLQDMLPAMPPLVTSDLPPKTSASGSRPLGWLRLLRNVTRCWIAYLGRIRPALRRGCLVVGDRWLYGYLVQPYALRYYGPRGLAFAILRLLPRPDLVVNLSAPPELIRSRKQELTLPRIQAELDGWATLPFDRLRTFDATSAPDDIAAQVLDALRSLNAPSPIGFDAAGLEQG